MALTWTTIAQLPLLILGLYIFTSYAITSFPTLGGKRICLLIAHPDDEAMFFSPTMLALTRPHLNNQLLILCLSSGDADGLGHIRKRELVKSARMLGVTHDEHVVVVEDPRFEDSMTQDWEAREVAKVLGHYFAPEMGKSRGDEAPKALVDVLITFDQEGVSGHPNHKSLFYGAKAFLDSLMQRHRGWECPVKMYSLTSTNVTRKYSSVLDAMVTTVGILFRKRERSDFPTPLVSVSGPLGIRRAQKAMTSAHQSQMRWFRWGWIGVSRYVAVNDLVKVKT